MNEYRNVKEIDTELANSLLLSIEGNRLVALTGAGLSMSPPSEIPSAADLAQTCSDRHRAITGDPLPDALISDIEQIANHFLDRGEFRKVFINLLIPWERFHSNPNPGHEAIADFLECDVLDFVVTTNVDYLIETAASAIGEGNFRATVDDGEINRGSLSHAPLLKLHSCSHRDVNNTIWSRRQFQDEPASKRQVKFKTWLSANLIDRDIIVLGYWTDWDYLNDLLMDSVSEYEPDRVIIVNPSSRADLEAKASRLWDWARTDDVQFLHVQMSASDFLDELRQRFSKQYIARLLDLAQPTYESLAGNPSSGEPDFWQDADSVDLYAVRRDLNGVTTRDVVRSNKPDQNQALVGAICIALAEAGAHSDGSDLMLDGARYRIIQGSGQVLSKIKERFSSEPLASIPADITVCVGAYDDGNARRDIMRSHEEPDIMRPGISGEWITHRTFLRDQGIEEQ